MNNNFVYIGVEGDKTQLDCTSVSNVYMSLELDHPNFDAIFSALLAAQHADTDATVRIVNESDNCKVSYVRVKRQ